MDKSYVVYIITNPKNNKKYIGMSKNIKRRWRNNGIEYVSNKNTPFSNAVKKYGFENFTKEIIKDNLTKKEACDLEIELIKKFKTRDNKYGYNVAVGGNGGLIYKKHPRGMLGKTHNKEFRYKKSLEMQKNNPCYKGFWSEEGREHPRGMLGKTHNSETKNKISKSCMGINSKKTIVFMPNRFPRVFTKRQDASNFLKISNTGSIFLKLLQTGEPFQHYYKKHQYLDGTRIFDIQIKDNPEITEKFKSFSVL